MPEAYQDYLICYVLTYMGETDWIGMGIQPPEDLCELLTVPFKEIRYILSLGQGSRIKLLSGEEFITTMHIDHAFTQWVEWQKRNPGK